MAGVIATIPKFQFSANGVPMVGGTLDTYIAGSTTPATTWQDSALTIANTNPISLDARGECVLWLDPAVVYKFVLKNAQGVIQWTQDNISNPAALANSLRADLAASSGASLVGFLQAGAGAVATTVQSKLRETVSITDFGAKVDGVTDDTAAWLAAIAYIKAITPWPTSTGRALNRPCIYVPAGVSKVSSTLFVDFSGFRVRGDGSKQSVIAWAGGDMPVFEIGTFSATPENIFLGPAESNFSDLRIQHASPGALDARQGQGIRCSGGGLVLDDVAVLGFKYGVNSPYGGDFNNYDKLNVEYCDVGAYQGPGGQQFITNHLNVFACREGLVVDRPGQMLHNLPIFINNGIADIVIESPGFTTTRQLTAFPGSGTSYQSQMVFNSPWFEGNAGGMGDDYIPTDHVRCNNNGNDAYRDITFNDPMIISGNSAGKTTTSFFSNKGAIAAQRVRHNRMVFQGVITRFLSNPGGDIITDYRITTGYTAPTMSDTTNYTVRTAGVRQEKSISSAFPFWCDYETVAGSGIRTEYAENGVMRYGFLNAGSYLYRFGFDIQNKRLFLGDPSANEFSLSQRATIPTAGTYAAGSFVYNTAPAVVGGKTLLGWQRLTTGSAHVLNTDWTPCYVTNT